MEFLRGVNMAHLSLTQKSLKWLITKIKNNHKKNEELEVNLSKIEKMLIHNEFYAPLSIDEKGLIILTDDSGNAILADWKYKIE